MLFWLSVWHEERGKKYDTQVTHIYVHTYVCLETCESEKILVQIELRALYINIKISLAIVAVVATDKLKHSGKRRTAKQLFESIPLDGRASGFIWVKFCACGKFMWEINNMVTPTPTPTWTSTSNNPATFFIENYERNRTNMEICIWRRGQLSTY